MQVLAAGRVLGRCMLHKKEKTQKKESVSWLRKWVRHGVYYNNTWNATHKKRKETPRVNCATFSEKPYRSRRYTPYVLYGKKLF